MPDETKQQAIHERILSWMGKKLDKLLHPPDQVVVLRLSGIIASGNKYQGAISIRTMGENIEKAFEYPRLKAVALIINSPGGAPAQASLIGKRIRDLADEKEVPVIAFVEDVAASGGYWLACCADEIYTNAASIVGSIGVISSGFGFVEAIKKLGIERRIHTAGKHKSVLDPFEPEKAEDVKMLTALQKELHTQFKAHVKHARGKKLNGTDVTLFNGDFWTGDKAVELGLVDGIGEMREVCRDRYGEDIEFKYIHKPRGWLERKVGLTKAGDITLSNYNLAEDALNAAEVRAMWARYGL